MKAEKFKYRGKEVWVLPMMRDMFPCVAINGPQGMSREDRERLLMRFLSSVSWVDDNFPQQCLYFFPLPQGQGVFRPILLMRPVYE